MHLLISGFKVFPVHGSSHIRLYCRIDMVETLQHQQFCINRPILSLFNEKFSIHVLAALMHIVDNVLYPPYILIFNDSYETTGLL